MPLKAIGGVHPFFGQNFYFPSIWKYFSLRFQRRKPRRKIIFSHGDMAETVEGTSGDLLYKIGSILGPKWGKTAIIFIKMGLICLKFGTLTRNYPIVRNTKENYDLQAEFRNYEANMAKITKIGEKRDFWKTTKNASPPSKIIRLG